MIAAGVGAYLAINIGANDVANNVGPAVGAKTLTLFTALLIAVIFETAGALIAGGEVVATIRGGIIDPGLISSVDTFIWIMLAALFAAAIWLNFATMLSAPVSTTHSIVGAVLGAGIAASGFGIANWPVVGMIAASWLISPVVGGVIAAGFLYMIKRSVTYQANVSHAAYRMVPLLVAVMAWAFVTYMFLKGVNKLITLDFAIIALIGLFVAVVTYVGVQRRIKARIPDLAEKSQINQLFNVPLIFAAAFLCFAHGSNDVANAIGPLAAIVDVVISTNMISNSSEVPLWILSIGALGIAFGLALFGGRVVRTVGSEITDIDQMRAYCIAMSATLTVIVASQLGIPVSSTHIAVGAVFGVGLLREYLKSNYARVLDEIKEHHPEDQQAELQKFMSRFSKASYKHKDEMLRELKLTSKMDKEKPLFSNRERKGLRKVYRRELVKRSLVMRIAAAWVITVPASTILSAMVYFTLRGMLLP